MSKRQKNGSKINNGRKPLPTKTPSRNKSWLYIISGIILALILTAVIIHRLRTEAQPFIWYEIGIPENLKPKLGQRFTVSSQLIKYINSLNDPVARLQVIVKNHPERQIREDLFQKFDNQEVFIELSSAKLASQELIASFTVAKQKDTNLKIPGKTVYPIFTLSEQFLMSPQTDQSVKQLWVVISHEYEHYLDWVAKGSPQEFGYHYNADRKNLPQECTIMWNGEFRAFNHECELQISWGEFPSLNGYLCEAINFQSAYNQRFFIGMEKLYGPKVPECLKTWAQLAGHPHPETYQ